LKNAKRLKDAPPFLQPVDPIKLGIPTYFDRIKHPMDISTIQKKLDDNIYLNAQQFMDDITLMFSNCYDFNGRDAIVSKMGQNLEKYFHKQMEKLPTAVCFSTECRVQRRHPKLTYSRSNWMHFRKKQKHPLKATMKATGQNVKFKHLSKNCHLLHRLPSKSH
jgi:hypothetical protein